MLGEGSVAAASTMSFREFMSTVDKAREGRFVDRVVSKLAEIDISEVEHLQSVTFEDMEWQDKPNAGMVGFIKLALKKCAVVPVEQAWGGGEEGEVAEFGRESALVRFLASKEQKPVHEHVDMAPKLAEVGLLVHLPSVVWPHSNAVCKLNKKIKGLLKAGQEVAFVAVDLCEYVL